MPRALFRPQLSRLFLVLLVLAATNARAQDRYPHVPPQLYRVGMLEWHDLRNDPDGKRRFNLFTDFLEAQRYLETYGGKDKTVYAIDKKDLVRTLEGRVFLQTLEQERVRNPEAGEWAVLLPDEASYVATIRKNAKVQFRPDSPPPAVAEAAAAEAVPGPGPPEKATRGAPEPDRYSYDRVPRIIYLVGQKTWDELRRADGEKRRLTVFSSFDAAREHAGGQKIYRIYRHTLEGTDDGKAFLEKIQAGKDADVHEMDLGSPDSYDRTVLQRAKTGNDLGPVNPNWKTTGRYETTPMLSKYDPGSPDEDFGQGTFYFPAQGPPEVVNFIDLYKVHFVKQRDGSVRLMRVAPDGSSFPVDTRSIRSDKPQGFCLFVMDAEGTFYVVAREWTTGLAAMGFEIINHSSISAGHRVAAAGMVMVHDGKLVALMNKSGHYRPSNRLTVQALNALERAGIAKGSYNVDFRAEDHPGRAYLALDPRGEVKVKTEEIKGPAPDDDPDAVAKPPIEEPPAKVAAEDEGLLKPDEPTPIPELEVNRLARQEAPAAAPPEQTKPVAPPAPEVFQRIEDRIEQTPSEQMDVAFIQELYQLDPSAAKIIGQVMADPKLAAKNRKMGEVRKTMDLQVWKEILQRRGIEVELTNQGKSNGVRSDLDYTLYYLAQEAGVSIKDLIDEHGRTWESLHRLTPDRLEIKVMNGDEFYPDWRNEALSEAEHQVQLRMILGELRADPQKYSTPGAFKQQVHNRALREGWTEVLSYDPLLDKPGIPVERQVIREQGQTRDIALRYHGVHPLYNHMNALGNLIQNKGEFLHHSGDNAQDAIRRAKYFNRVINEGLGNLRFLAHDYQQLFSSTVPDRETLKLEYLKKTFGVLTDEKGRPLLDDAQLKNFRDIIDIAMHIELDKVREPGFDYDAQRGEYFKKYLAEAKEAITEQTKDQDITSEERDHLVLAEQQRRFERDQKLVLADALLAGLRHSVARDLTPEGALRNRVRFDPATQKFVLDDPEAAKKIAFERATEVALFYELVNSLDDNDPTEKFMKRDIKKAALATAPNTELAEFYGALDEVGKAEIDRFVAGEPGNKVQRKIDDLMRNQQARVLELLVERKDRAVDRARAKGVVVDPNAIPPAEVRDHIVSARLDLLNPYRRGQFRSAFRALGTGLFGPFKESFYNNASALMLGSSAVNLTRAWQGCHGQPPDRCRSLLGRAAWSEAINYMPDMVQMALTPVDMLAKVRIGAYGAAAWQGTLVTGMALWPSLGHFMLSYNIVTGSVDIVHTHFVSRIDADLLEQALRSRPRNETGGALRDGVRARPNRFPDATKSVYHGSGPGFPLFYGRYKKNHPSDPTTVAQGYLDGSVPEDNLSDLQLADSATIEFAPLIDSVLAAEHLQPGSPEWRKRASDLKLKYGFDVPFYRRMAKVYAEKYKDVQWWEKWPGRYNKDYLEECRLDVYDWYVQQPPGYKLELEGDAKFWFGDQSDEMQEQIARGCAEILGGMHEVATKAQEVDEANQEAFKDAMSRSFNAERALLAAKTALVKRIQGEEETAAGALDQKALALADRHQTYFSMSYPFTYATEEHWPVLHFDMRTLPSHVKQPAEIVLDQNITEITVGAPSGWVPGKAYEEKFKPDAQGRVAYRPVTATMNFTAHLLDADQKPAAEATLDIPVVLYEPAFLGQISVTVFARSATGDSARYPGAVVTVDSAAGTSDRYGVVDFSHLAAGGHAVKVAPGEGDARHGPGAASASLVDVLVANKDLIGSERGGEQATSVTVVLPYIPEPVAVAGQSNKTGAAGGEKKAKGDSAAATHEAGKDSVKAGNDSVKAKNDSMPAKNDSVTVPDVTGIADAKRRDSVLALAGLKAAYEAAGNPPSKDRELTVAGQKPKGGTRARRGDAVTIAVYQDFVDDSVTVPDVTGIADAKQRDSVLAGAGLKAAYEAAGNPPSKDRELTVAGQKPKGGARVKRGDVVTIAVYQQFAEDSVTVPDLSVFTNGSEMQAVLNHAGLKSAFGTPLPAPSKDEEFKVASQSPSAGARVSRGTVVTVTAYGGFAGAVPMPNLVGLTPDQVTVQLQGGGLVIASVDSTAPPPSPDQERRIYEQVPAAGEPVPADNRVTLRQYASTPQPPPGAEWSGTYVESNSTIVLSGSAAGLSASFTYEVGAAKGSGSWTGCQVEGNTAKCNWTAAHEDETKSGTRSGTVQVTLDGNSITGSYTENEPVFSYKPGYSAATIVSSMHQGVTWPINATRK